MNPAQEVRAGHGQPDIPRLTPLLCMNQPDFGLSDILHKENSNVGIKQTYR